MASGKPTVVAELSRTIDGVKSGLEELQQSLNSLQKASTGWATSFTGNLRSALQQINETKRGFDKLSSTIQRANSVPGVVSGARISQALGASTGQVGGGGGGGGAQPFGSQFARTAMSPLRHGLPMLAGSLAQLPFSAAGGLTGGVGSALGKLPIASRLMKGLGRGVAGLGSNVVRPMVEGAVHMGLGFGTQYIQQSMAMQEQLERGGRFIGRNGGQVRGMANIGLKHGYDVMQTMSHRESVARAIGGGGPQEGMIQAMSNRLRQPMGSVIGAAGALRGGGMGADAIAGVLQRVESGVENAGFGRETPAFIHRIESLLQAISGFTQQQVAITGSANTGQTTSFQNLVQTLSNKAFSPTAAAQTAQQLVNIPGNPGGGESGKIFVQRALGFGNPNLAATRAMAKKMGVNPNLVRPRSYSDYLDFIENNRTQAAQLVGVQTAVEFPGSAMQSIVLGKVLSNMGVTKAGTVMKSLRSGGLSNIAQPGGTQQTAAQVGAASTKAMMGIDPKMITVLNEYHRSLATLAGIPGGTEGIKNLAELIRTFQVLGGTAVATGFTEVFAELLKELKKAMAGVPLETIIKTEIEGVSGIVKELIRKLLGKPAPSGKPSTVLPQVIGGPGSDIRLKKDLVFVGQSPSGINIYDFQYIAEPGIVYRGVMAQELLYSHADAVIWDSRNEHYRVDYDKIDVDFVQREGYGAPLLQVSHGYL